MTHLSLFSGIGGLDLAAEWAGFQTVGQCEWADYPTKVLEKHWPDVPKWRDIRDLTADDFRRRTGIDRPTIISGGFPCQPFSVAGKQKGKGDDRYLWPEMLRVIRELAPRWVVGENVPGILRIAADEVCADLERLGYEVGVFDFEAAAVGALHRRERIAFVGYAKHDGSSRAAFTRGSIAPGHNDTQRPKASCESTGASRSCRYADVADTNNSGLQVARHEPGFRAVSAGNRTELGCGWTAKSALGGMVDGLSRWLDGYWRVEPEGVPRITLPHSIESREAQIKCLGNAVVPQQFYPIFKAIADMEAEHAN